MSAHVGVLCSRVITYHKAGGHLPAEATVRST